MQPHLDPDQADLGLSVIALVIDKLFASWVCIVFLAFLSSAVFFPQINFFEMMIRVSKSLDSDQT